MVIMVMVIMHDNDHLWPWWQVQDVLQSVYVCPSEAAAKPAGNHGHHGHGHHGDGHHDHDHHGDGGKYKLSSNQFMCVPVR